MRVQVPGHLGSGVRIVEPAEGFEQVAHVALGERLDDGELREPVRHQRARKSARRRVELRRPVRADEHHATLPQSIGQEMEHLEARGIRPVHVVHGD